MTLPLLVAQNNHVRRLTDPAALAAHDLGVAVHDLSSDQGIAMRPPVPEGGPWGPILVIGSVLFVDQWARQDPILSEWVFWNDERYDADLWSRELGPLFLNHDGRSTTTGEFIASDEGPRHVRPRSGVKLIGDVVADENTAGRRGLQGSVVTPAELGARNVDPSLPIWISPPSRIDAEVRVWMIGGKPAAWSTYRVDGKPVHSVDHPVCAPAVEAAQRIAAVFSPDRHFVIDVCLTNGEWKMVECNPIHSSGWYASDPAIIMARFFENEAPIGIPKGKDMSRELDRQGKKTMKRLRKDAQNARTYSDNLRKSAEEAYKDPEFAQKLHDLAAEQMHLAEASEREMGDMQKALNASKDSSRTRSVAERSAAEALERALPSLSSSRVAHLMRHLGHTDDDQAYSLGPTLCIVERKLDIETIDPTTERHRLQVGKRIEAAEIAAFGAIRFP